MYSTNFNRDVPIETNLLIVFNNPSNLPARLSPCRIVPVVDPLGTQDRLRAEDMPQPLREGAVSNKKINKNFSPSGSWITKRGEFEVDSREPFKF
jgi:hypothetical protein